MKPSSVFPHWRRLALLLAAALPSLAWAGCSRPMVVPVSPIGASVIVQGDKVSGVYPEVLRQMGARAGCKFRFSAVPRARLEAMFEAGRADLLIPATHTARRDRLGNFVPWVGVRATVISIAGSRAPIRSVHELLARKELRVALVRGFDFGETYQAMIVELTAQGRLMLEADAVGVARLLDAGYADVTVMPPNIFEGALKGDPRVASMAGRLREEALEELPWGESGIYISSAAVSGADRAAIEKLIAAAIHTGAVHKAFERHYPELVRDGTIRPRSD